MFRSKTIAAIAGLGFALSTPAATVGDATSLQDIMQGLRDDLIKITDGLLVDDFELIANGALGIAEHQRIPAQQLKLVAAELGAEMPAFKQLDTLVHDLSMAIRAAAEAADRDTAYRHYQEMTNGCLGCHVLYKERIAAVLRDATTR